VSRKSLKVSRTPTIKRTFMVYAEPGKRSIHEEV